MKKIFCVLLALCLLCGVLASCNETPAVEEGNEKSDEKSYTVTFETNGGSAVNSIRRKPGELLTPPAAPVKDGCTFAGWYADESLLDEYVFGEMPAEDITLYAKWTPVTDDGSDDGKDEDEGDGSDAVCEACYEAAECEPYEFYGTVLSVCADCKQRLEDLLTHKYCFTCLKEAECEPYEYDGEIIYICADCKAILESLSGGGTENGDEGDIPTPDASGPFTVTFKYVNTSGDPLADVHGRTQEKYENIVGGANAQSAALGDVQLFADHVILGWNDDFAEAKAGTVDVNCTKNIQENKTLYSVTRKKAMCNVTLLRADGVTVFKTLQLKEGSAIDASLEKPVDQGTYFKEWRVSGNSASSLACIRDDCTLVPVVGKTDGTIGKVTAGTIKVDGVKDAAYTASGAYLPHNATLQADHAWGSKDEAHGGSRAVPTVSADTYVVWDGEYIYLLIEVSDKSLVGRSDAYLKNNADAWLNDGIELWYSFEQDALATKNNTRVGLDAMGYSKYAAPLYTGIGGGRSTHYEDIRYAVRNCLLGYDGNDLSKTGYVGNATYNGTGSEPEPLASYIIELAIPAWTEGAADSSKGADPQSGLLPNRATDSNNINDYAFTSGDKLQVGNFVRFNLQINDLMLGQREMTGAAGTYFWDSPPEDVMNNWAGAAGADHSSMLYATDGLGNIVGVADITGVFSASGATQRDLRYYVMLTLGENASGESKVYALDSKTVGGRTVPVMLKQDGSEYVRE